MVGDAAESEAKVLWRRRSFWGVREERSDPRTYDAMGEYLSPSFRWKGRFAATVFAYASDLRL